VRPWRSSECDMCRIATTLFTGLLRYVRNDKGGRHWVTNVCGGGEGAS